MAAESNLENPIYVGEDQLITFTVFQSDRVTVQNVSGYTFTFKLIKADTVVATIVPAIITAASGTVGVTFASATTVSLNPGQYEYFLRRTDSGYRTVLAHGFLELQDTPSWS